MWEYYGTCRNNLSKFPHGIDIFFASWYNVHKETEAGAREAPKKEPVEYIGGFEMKRGRITL